MPLRGWVSWQGSHRVGSKNHCRINVTSFINHKKNDKALSVENKIVVVNSQSTIREWTADWGICHKWKDYIMHQICHSTGHWTWTSIQSICSSCWNQNCIPSVEIQCSKLERTHKFGIKLPKMVDEAIVIGKKNRNTYLQDAIAKEMKNIKIAFCILPDDEKTPNRFQFINSHMIIEVKVELS